MMKIGGKSKNYENWWKIKKISEDMTLEKSPPGELECCAGSVFSCQGTLH